jgi:hypothetical protein
MTTCPYCLATAARSHRQLQNRLRNIKKFSDMKVFECPKCGGTEWTTTEAMVEPEPQPKRWQRSYLLQAFSAARVGIRKRYRQLAQFKKKREIADG